MTFVPIVERELRAESRHTFTYWLRVLGASVLFGVFLVTVLDQRSVEQGAALFSSLNTALFIAIWTLVPLLTADCLSRERREGTLGLLFLTPLTSRAIVVGKSLIHSLRAVTMLLAALPVLALPFLLGGVTWREGVMALLLNLSSTGLALAAGLVASSWCKGWIRALALSEVIAAIFLLLFGSLVLFAVSMQVAVPYVPFSQWQDANFVELLAGAAILCTGADEVWSQASSFLPPAGLQAWIWTTAAVFLTSLLATALVISCVARRLRRIWQEEPPSTRKLQWQRFFLEPRFWSTLFRRKMRRTLERNPIGWLHQYSTGARVTKWGWCLFIVVMETLLVGFVDWYVPIGLADWYELNEPQAWLALLLALSLAFSAAGSFRRERDTGALELILVAPLRVGQIIAGRLRGLWGQFLPAFASFFLAVTFLLESRSVIYWQRERFWGVAMDIVVLILTFTTYLTLPVIGLYFSLARKHFLSAWLMTAMTGLLLPLFGVAVVLGLAEAYLNHFGSFLLPDGAGSAGIVLGCLLMIGAQVAFALMAFSLLHRNLRRRGFVLS